MLFSFRLVINEGVPLLVNVIEIYGDDKTNFVVFFTGTCGAVGGRSVHFHHKFKKRNKTQPEICIYQSRV
ncbi:hypothetical protein C5167_012491 [Papaver somniferum]|uniref:Uncharacterized protein n=1 Tax=Papaver somniferum TaxID=3469 RepID=A0A4Y7IXL4_PAPSO|nr:hypothetical protein C5167_012491 [Papaver somniferum]